MAEIPKGFSEKRWASMKPAQKREAQRASKLKGELAARDAKKAASKKNAPAQKKKKAVAKIDSTKTYPSSKAGSARKTATPTKKNIKAGSTGRMKEYGL